MTAEQRERLNALAQLPDDQIDTSDIPVVLDWSGAERGVFYRAPQLQKARSSAPAANPKQTDTSERGLEARIVRLLTDGRGDAANAGEISERPAAYSAGWIAGEPADYDRGNCVDLKTARGIPRRYATRLGRRPGPRLRQSYSPAIPGQAEARNPQPWRY